jgi:hypothetical protein
MNTALAIALLSITLAALSVVFRPLNPSVLLPAQFAFASCAIYAAIWYIVNHFKHPL